MKNFIILFAVAASFSLNAQTFSSANPDYIKNVKAGEQALLSENYDSCLVYYKQGFQIKQTSVLSTLRAAACAYSLGDSTYMDDQLDIAFSLDWGVSKNIYEGYPEFEYLQDTPFSTMINERWETTAKASGVNFELMNELEQIGFEDQVYRQQMRSVDEEYGRESSQMDSLWKLQNFADSVNTDRIVEILEEYGYPGKSMVGPAEASTAFLVIQHADLEIQQRYVELIVAAADAEEIRWSSVALLVDRINMRKGNPQKYGTQLGRDKETGEYYFSEIEQPFKIDSVRGTVGLGPLQNYADNWSYTWDPEIHIKKAQERKKKKSAKKE